jgi:hypothetical protein
MLCCLVLVYQCFRGTYCPQPFSYNQNRRSRFLKNAGTCKPNYTTSHPNDSSLQDSILLRHDATLPDIQLPVFWRNTLPSSSQVCISDKIPLNIHHVSQLWSHMCGTWYTSYLCTVTNNLSASVHHGTKACTPVQKKSMSDDCKLEVTACFTSVFVANCSPVRCFLKVKRDGNHWVQL